MRVSDSTSTLVEDSIVTQTLFIGFILLYQVIELNSFDRGMEIGLIHGYFLVGPFYVLGPFRNSSYGLIISLLATLGLIIIATTSLYAFSDTVLNFIIFLFVNLLGCNNDNSTYKRSLWSTLYYSSLD